MPTSMDQPALSDFVQTCWRGIRLSHPADWEPAALSGLNEPGQILFADRRFQRLQVQWRQIRAEPDLGRMYQQLRQKSLDRGPVAPLEGVPGWTGLVRQEAPGTLVHAGRYFPQDGWLVQVVLVWPGQRDRGLERAVLELAAPLESGPTVTWRALGMWADVPRKYDLARSSSLVGHVAWEFDRTGRAADGLSLERIAMARYWLKSPLEDWLAGQLPEGFKPSDKRTCQWAGHAGAMVASRRGGWFSRVRKASVARNDWAWVCPQQERVYRVACWQREPEAARWPAGLTVHCCGDMAGLDGDS